VLCGLLGACSVTNTGNPHVASNDSHPEGITLLRSELARDTTPQLSEDEQAQFGADQRKLTFALYAQLSKDNPNLFFSPYSIATALAMVYAGAKAETKQEMATALSFSLPEPTLHAAFNATALALAERESELEPGNAGDGFELSINNANFAHSGLDVQPAFLDVLATHYDAGLFVADFSAAERERMAINAWVSERTAKRVDEVLPPGSLDERTRMVLVNSIYFKGSWQHAFKPENTFDSPFHSPDGDKIVPMMSGKVSRYLRADGYQAAELQYISPKVRMLLILPDEGKLAEVEQRLTTGLFDEARSGLAEQNVYLRLPRFSFSNAYDLVPVFRALGMARAFKDADFSGIAGAPGYLFIGGIYHQAFIGIDEKGSEAAAATAVVFTTRSVDPSFTFDRPFLFAIYDDPTGQILFAGKLSDP
jgi:serpin B